MTVKLTQEAIQSSLTVKDGQIIWKERDADFYRAHFARSYSPEGAAANWNIKTAGRPPAWRYSKEYNDFVCTMLMQRIPLKKVTDALGLPYDAVVADVRAMSDVKKAKEAKAVVKATVDLIDGVPHWKVRTSAAFPKTPAAKLIEFNSTYAGRPIAARADGTYRIRFYYVTLAQIKGWLK